MLSIVGAFDAAMNSKFYVIQLLTNGRKYYEFTRWGRIGQLGNHKIVTFDNAAAAEQSFKRRFVTCYISNCHVAKWFDIRFSDKTGNEWDQRKHFSAKPGKYTLLDMEYQDDDVVDVDNLLTETNNTTEFVAKNATTTAPSVLQPLQLQPTVPSTQKYKVDSECKLDGVSRQHTYEIAYTDGRVLQVQVHEDYACVLNQTNIAANNNRFYILQMLTNQANKFWVFSRWGRVGETGQSALRECDTLNAAVADFKKKLVLND